MRDILSYIKDYTDIEKIYLRDNRDKLIKLPKKTSKLQTESTAFNENIIGNTSVKSISEPRENENEEMSDFDNISCTEI